MESAPCTVTLWHASGVEVPRELLAALTGVKSGPGGVKVHVVGDPFLALARLCRATREEHRGPAEPTHARLVIVFPELLTDAAELCAAADTYAPGVPRWQYGPATNPMLRPIVEADMAMWGSRSTPVVVLPEAVRAAETRPTAGPAIPKASRTTAPHLRLAGEGPGGTLDNRPQSADGGAEGPMFSGEGAGQASPPVTRSTPLITDEELRMLLGESNDESR